VQVVCRSFWQVSIKIANRYPICQRIWVDPAKTKSGFVKLFNSSGRVISGSLSNGKMQHYFAFIFSVARYNEASSR